LQRPKLLSLIKYRLNFVNDERWFRWVARKPNAPSTKGFFDDFPRFLSTSDTAANLYRLNQRHIALIQSNAELIRGRRVLDIASHDGRWSFAAHKAGAEYVLGIEARAHLTDQASATMQHYGVPRSRVEFIQGDVLSELDRIEAGHFDTVFCFGFLYHTADHMLCMRKIARLQPMSLIIDTAVATYPGSIVEIYDEALAHESAGAVGDPGDPERIVVGRPSKPALELMMRGAGFSVARYYNWRQADIQWVDDLKEYYLGKRITVTANAIAGRNATPMATAGAAQR
jgi:ubiquinone/menaquinone biosynthesis C-methylase UbiE